CNTYMCDKYHTCPLALASPVENPDNQCYCTDPVLTRNCTTAGLLDLTACKGTPVLLSLPHFLYGSNDLHQGVIGLNPNFDEHSIFLDVEPITGFTLRFAKRLQVNMLYGPSDSIVILNKIKDYTVFPILWVNEVSVNEASISLKQLGPAKVYRPNKAPIITLVFPFSGNMSV
uniref:Platelet glycoprotein 4 n=1 Tax=Sinocyclocheilus rhinocerous TaxID=307959 RepID=A0A673FKN4_9TELE